LGHVKLFAVQGEGAWPKWPNSKYAWCDYSLRNSCKLLFD